MTGERDTMLSVRQLISLLQNYPPEAEVYIAHQPLWPLSYEISGLVSDSEIQKLSEKTWRINEPQRVWIMEGSLHGAVSDAIWRAGIKKRGT